MKGEMSTNETCTMTTKGCNVYTSQKNDNLTQVTTKNIKASELYDHIRIYLL